MDKFSKEGQTFLFTYGTLMSDGPLNHHLKRHGCEYVCDGVTDVGWDMDSLGAFPIATRPMTYNTDFRILGEVWSIPWVMLPILDQVEGSLYTRSGNVVSCLDDNDKITKEVVGCQIFTARVWEQPKAGPLPDKIVFHPQLNALAWANRTSKLY